MQSELRRQLESYLRPLYQDLDGANRMAEVERIGSIARRIHPAGADDRHFELLLLFHGLGRWLEKIGNVTRTVLAVPGIAEEELRAVMRSIRRFEAPESEAERAIAAAILIDSSGVRGLADSISRSRREGSSLTDVLRSALSDVREPEWLAPNALSWLRRRRVARRDMCRAILDELSLDA